jgi:hypothetical protein
MARKEYSRNIYRLRGTPAQFIGSVEAPYRTPGNDR